MMRLVLAALLCASTGCIITEDAAGSGVTLEVEWTCPPDADEIGLVAYPLDDEGFIDGDGVPDTRSCGDTQPARFLYDPGDWYVEAKPTGSGEYYLLWDTFAGEDMETASLTFDWDPNLGAFFYRWEISDANPATACNSLDVNEVTLTATQPQLGETYADTFPCSIGQAQSRPMPLDEYMISGAPDGGAETVAELPYELVDPAGLLTIDTIDIAIAAE